MTTYDLKTWPESNHSVDSESIENSINSDRLHLFTPDEYFSSRAHVPSLQKYFEMYKKSIEDPSRFWSEIACSNFFWKEINWEAQVYSENLDIRNGNINIEWFKGGVTNICYNCIDRNIEAGIGDKIAFYWEGNEPGFDATLTYTHLLHNVSQLGNFMRDIGIKKGDAVLIYLPMLMQLPISMLACARIGAIHSVVFAGFSSDSLAQRIIDCKPKLVITCNAVKRGSKIILLKDIVDDALLQSTKGGVSVEACLVYENEAVMKRESTQFVEGRDQWWQATYISFVHDIGLRFILRALYPMGKNYDSWAKSVAHELYAGWSEEVPKYSSKCPVEWMDAEDPLFLLYTSGSTGKPKGVVHTTGGYMVYAATTFKYIFDYKPSDIFWCTADCGWVTGHSYVTYGPLINGASVVIFEGVPNYPDAGRCWDIVDKYSVTIFYTAPTLIRSLMGHGDAYVSEYSRKSLRVLGCAGEPINPSAWRWYFEVVGESRCPIVDSWWQTETGASMISPLPGAWPLKPGSATFPFFGVQIAIVDEEGHEIEGECSGYLCIKSSWPSAFRTLHGNHHRYEETYFKPFPGYYFTGDGCTRDKDGYYWVTGRVDDVMNVSGHRIGTAEVESSLASHPHCAEAAVVGVDHEVKGQSIHAFVTLVENVTFNEEIKNDLILTVRKQIGAFASPEKIHWAPNLPKTRSGKIMRRILRKIASRQLHDLGDITTLVDPSVVDQLILFSNHNES